MKFPELYCIAAALKAPPVGFDFLRHQVTAKNKLIERVDVWAVEYPAPTEQAHFRLGHDRSSPYDEEFVMAEIIYCHTLEADKRELRYALTKELMHIFDSPDALVDTPEKFESLLKEIQNQPLPEDQSAAMKSELDARWMAALTLCPKNFRDTYVADYNAKKIADFDIAEIFDIPEWVAPFVMDDYYNIAFRRLVDGK